MGCLPRKSDENYGKGRAGMRFPLTDMAAVTSWKSPERRSDGFASSEVKETSSLNEDHLFEKVKPPTAT
jgi:hypothetical protein